MLRNLAITAKRVLSVFLLGAATGAYSAYGYEHGRAQTMENIVARGYCGQRDITGTLYYFACTDAYIATELQRRDAERDAEVTAILSDMATAKPLKKAVKQ